MILRKGKTKPEKVAGNDRLSVGTTGESLAADALQKRGYQILELNYRSRLGEIDIIAKEGNTLIFVEVKARRTDDFGSPKIAVTKKKQRKISMVALEYLKKNDQMNENARFDVVAIRLLPGRPEIEIIKNAFDLAY